MSHAWIGTTLSRAFDCELQARALAEERPLFRSELSEILVQRWSSTWIHNSCYVDSALQVSPSRGGCWVGRVAGELHMMW
jgi:hypothetical protein